MGLIYWMGSRNGSVVCGMKMSERSFWNSRLPDTSSLLACVGERVCVCVCVYVWWEIKRDRV